MVLSLTMAASAGQAPGIRIRPRRADALVSGPTRIEIAFEPQDVAATVQQVTFSVNGRLTCTIERPPFTCAWDPGDVVRGHHLRVVATLADGRRLTDNLRTKDLGFADRVRTDAVLVPVMVTRGGQFVRGLKPQDFEILEDGVRQSIASMASEESPLDLVLAVDVSGSMEQALSDVKVAVKQFLSKLRQGDAATLVGFNDTLFLATEREKDPQARERAVDLLTAWGGTALYDATVAFGGAREPRVGPEGHRDLFRRRRPQQPDVARGGHRARAGEQRDALHRRVRWRRDGPRPAHPARRLCAVDGRPRVLSRARAANSTMPSTRLLRSWKPVRALVFVDQLRAGQRLAEHQGPRANGQVRHQGQAGIPGGRPAPGGEVIMRIDNLSTLAMAAAAAALLASGVPSLPAQQAGTDQPAAFRSGVEVVTVDVGVVDKQGQPMRGLTAADFMVTVGGQPQAGGDRGVRRSPRRAVGRPLRVRAWRRSARTKAAVPAGCSRSSSIRTRSSRQRAAGCVGHRAVLLAAHVLRSLRR